MMNDTNDMNDMNDVNDVNDISARRRRLTTLSHLLSCSDLKRRRVGESARVSLK